MAKFNIKWSDKSKNDLSEILKFYNIRNGNSIYSKKIYTEIRLGVKLISNNPEIGFKTAYTHYRSLIIMDYKIIYQILDLKNILIDVIWDCRLNPNDIRIGKVN